MKSDFNKMCNDESHIEDNDYLKNEVAFSSPNEEAIKRLEELKKQSFPDLTVYAFLPSVEEYDKYFYQYRAFMGAFVPDNAEKELIKWRNKTDYAEMGNYYLRTPKFARSGYPQIAQGLASGVRCWDGTYDVTSGLRVAFRLVYDPKSQIVKQAKVLEQTVCVYECKNQPEVSSRGKNVTVTSKAPIIEFAGKECIWLNKEDCEKGYSSTMECWGLYLLVSAKPFAMPWEHNDFAKSALLQQCEDFLLKNCSLKERKLLVKVAMNFGNRYETITPLFTKRQQKIVDKVHDALRYK